MATVTARAIVWNTTAGNKTTPSFTPAANDLLVAIVGIATLDTAPTLSDSQGGATWVLVDSFRSQATTGGLRMYVRSAAVANTSMTVSYTSSGDAGGGIAVLSVSDPAVYGAGAVRSSGGQADQATATPAPVLNQTPRSTNAIITAVMNNTNGSANASPRTSPAYSEHYDQGFNTPPTGIAVHSVNSGETSATITYGGSTTGTFASIAIEINSPVSKSGQATAEFTASGSSASENAETGTAIISDAVASGTKEVVLTHVKQGTAQSEATVESQAAVEFAENGTAIVEGTASGVYVADRPRAGQATLGAVASALGEWNVSRTGAGITNLVGSGASVLGGATQKAGVASAEFSPSAAAEWQVARAGSAVAVAVASGAYAREWLRGGSAVLGAIVAGIAAPERPRAGSAALGATASGTALIERLRYGAAITVLTGTGTRGEFVFFKDGTAISTFGVSSQVIGYIVVGGPTAVVRLLPEPRATIRKVTPL